MGTYTKYMVIHTYMTRDRMDTQLQLQTGAIQTVHTHTLTLPLTLVRMMIMMMMMMGLPDLDISAGLRLSRDAL